MSEKVSPKEHSKEIPKELTFLTLARCLSTPSDLNWDSIVRIGQQMSESEWPNYIRVLSKALEGWPKELERVCPSSWPESDRLKLENRPRETSTYGLYIQKICTDSRLQLSDGSQAVWLERRFTGGSVQASVTQRVVAMLLECIRYEKSGVINSVRQAANLLSGAIRNSGKVGTADLTGGLTLELRELRCETCSFRFKEHNYAEDNYPASKGPPFQHPINGKTCGRYRYIVRKVEVRLEIEVKVGDGKQRKEQKVREDSVVRRGGCYVLCNSVEEAITQILTFRDSFS